MEQQQQPCELFLGNPAIRGGNFRECMGVFWVTNGASGWVFLKQRRRKKKNVRVINRTGGGGDGVAGGNSHQE